jgi:hypothetical protein
MANGRDRRPDGGAGGQGGRHGGYGFRDRPVLWIVIAAVVLVGVFLFMLMGGTTDDPGNGVVVENDQDAIVQDNGGAADNGPEPETGAPAETPADELDPPLGVPPAEEGETP